MTKPSLLMVFKILFTLEQVLWICFDAYMPKEGKL